MTMTRVPDIDDARCAALKAEYLAAPNEGPDYSPEADRNRAEIFAGSVLKPGDDLQLFGVPEFVFRVVCAGEGTSNLSIYYPPWFGDVLINLDIGDPLTAITDRAPLDPNETPMPVFPPVAIEALRVAAAKKAKGGHEAKHDRKLALKAVVASLPHKQAKELREHLQAVGALGKDE